MKGIILAGGKGSRLYPTSLGVSKQLLAIYDKPLLYYPLATLMQAEIQEILVISTPTDLKSFQQLLGDGSQFGISISYDIQENPNGIAEAFLIAEEFIGKESVCLVLGDNIFIGDNFTSKLVESKKNLKGGKIFGYQVADPERFGVITFNSEGEGINLEEKPKKPKSNFAVTGLYFYENSVVKISKELSPSDRGELEITDVNLEYLKRNALHVDVLDEGFTWFDAGTHDAMIEAGLYVQTLERRQGVVIACPEVIGYRNGWINKEQVLKQISLLKDNHYAKYLETVISN